MSLRVKNLPEREVLHVYDYVGRAEDGQSIFRAPGNLQLDQPPQLMLVQPGSEPPLFATITYDDLEDLLARREDGARIGPL
jgi:hypothetical protein